MNLDLDYLISRIKNGELIEKPFSYKFITNIFPSAFYSQLITNIPNKSYYSRVIDIDSNAKRTKYSAENYLGLEITSIYWHFLSILWVYLFFFLKYL